ncbi:MAG: SMI1/KNR4 family protein [Lachnospiraceae bacterium]|nr:SMI1/KNR4 family protein [Lachnospiraceae bacterium]MBQ8319208.1 SMI1/KNR4 family protein [Lachnospiraceae bacterium]
MTLEQIESILQIKFPKKWWEIHSKGIMEWMELSINEFREKREEYIFNPNSFLMLECDCEALFFDDIPERLDILKEWISWREEDENLVFDDNKKLIPFAQTGGGDLYCFLYENSADEPKIVLYFHDVYDDPQLEAHSFDEFLYVILLSSASWEGVIDDEHWRAHYQLLNEEYKQKIDNRSVEDLAEEYENKECVNVNIWK